MRRASPTALRVKYDVLPIESAVLGLEKSLAPIFAGMPRDVTEENLQARARGTILMAISNKFGLMVVTTGNKSEMSVGYATLYGDMNGGFNPIKDLYKTEVYRLSRLRNAWKPDGALGPDGPVIPDNILTRAPTAELRENQTDQDSLPPYDVLDAHPRTTGRARGADRQDRRGWLRPRDRDQGRAHAQPRRIQAPAGGARRQGDAEEFRPRPALSDREPLPRFRRAAAGARSLAVAGRRAEERCIRFLSGRRRKARTPSTGEETMYKASAGIALPTSIIGSLPRPNWYTAVLGSRSFLEAMVNSRYREQYEDAVSCFLRAQEIAGLDICTDGDAHYDEEVGGMSWQSYPLTHMDGFADVAEAMTLQDRRRRVSARAYPARFPRSPRVSEDRRAGRTRQTAICRDVEDGAAHDQEADQVRDHPARADRRVRRGRLLQGSGRAHMGDQRCAQRGAQRARRCRLSRSADGGAADPHGAGARQDLRQARRRRPGEDLQQHRERPARQDRGVVPHLLGQPVPAAHLPRRAELSADAGGARTRSRPTR